MEDSQQGRESVVAEKTCHALYSVPSANVTLW